ncbi:metallophosphoesterase family protein [Desertivirga brevis]|uniref:metallophosphoesterase family protein n=1 Tax=Desertivirga brevis TaxID=2810310 RepID=UPI001A966F4E|nr:metallophosphoesterase family protein [Pedobacter sp. SYSU D00873]
MKIVLFSDVHANLPALDAFFKDIDTKEYDAIYCLGDLVGYNVWPNEVIAEIRRRKIPTIAGNHDIKVKKLRVDQHLNDEEALVNYAYHLGTETSRQYLKNLPCHIKVEFKQNDLPLNLMLVHGSNRSVSEYVLEDLDETYVLELMQESGAHIFCCGHTHKPYHRVIESEGQHLHVINIGALGKPKDGDVRGCYVMLTIDENSSLDNPDSITVEFCRVEYDVEKAAKAVEESPLPNEFADRLRKAY